MTNLPVLPQAAIRAYEHLLLPVWVFSVESLRILAVNSAAQDWLGYDAQTLQAMTIIDLRPPTERARLVARVRQFDGAVTDAGTWTIVGKSGDHYAASFAWSKVVFEGTEAIVASIRDVTRTVRAETRADSLSKQNEALRKSVSLSAEHLSRLFDGLPGKMLVLTPGDYRMVAVTEEYAEAVMQEPGALIGQRLFDVFPDDPADPQADGVHNLYASLQRVEALRVTDVMNLQRYPVRQPDGAFQERFWLPRNKPVLDAEGNVIYIVHRAEDVTAVLSEEGWTQKASDSEAAHTRDLTETRTALFALQERETRLKTAEMLLDLGSWEYDVERGTLTWSGRVFDIYGVPRHHAVPDFAGYVALVHPDDQEEMLANYNRFIESGAPELRLQHRVIRADDTIAHVRGVGARHRSDGREILIGFVQDITSIKRGEEELRTQVRRRKLAGHLARLGSWRFDIGQTHIMWGEVTTAIHDEPEGFSPTLEQGIAYYIPEHRDRIREKFEDCVGQGTPFDEILQIISAKGRRVWVRAFGEPIRNAAGQITAVEGAFQDVTDLIAARDEAAALSERLSRTLEGMSDAFYLLDSDWRFTFLNSTAERFLKRNRDELLGQIAWDVFPEAAGNIKRQYERALREGRLVRFEEHYWPLETWFEISADPLPSGLAVYFRDITARKQAEADLEANEERFRLVTKAAGNAIWDWDLNTGRQWWSEGLHEIFGHEVDASEAVPTTWRANVHPDDLSRVDAAFERVLSGQSAVLRERYRFRRADGSWALVEESAFALRNEGGSVTRILGSMADITERHQLEERLLQAQKLEVVGQLTGGVAHDFNNLLTIILGNAEILEEELSAQPHLQQLAKMSLGAADRGAELTGRLLAFARKQALEPKVLDVAQLIQGMDGLLRRTLPATIDIEIVRSGGLWKIEADAGQLESALLNLAVNARDAMPEGGCLTIEMANAMLDDDYVSAQPDVKAGQYVVIVVTDTGQGIPPELITRVFEPFFTTKEPGKGSGLGLSMVFGFVKQSGGHIRVYSELGEGTSFKLYFPRARAAQAPFVTDRAGRKISGGSETILVVEDDAAVRAYVSTQLKGLGYHVLEASTGAEAMEVVTRRHDIDLLFTDVVMPGGMSGRELVEAAQKSHPSLKVLFTSGYTENSIVHNGKLDPGVKLLTKPYRREQLAGKVREVLDEE